MPAAVIIQLSFRDIVLVYGRLTAISRIDILQQKDVLRTTIIEQHHK